MTEGEREFCHQHAYEWALTERTRHDEDAARAYADWYVREFGEYPLDEAPSHPNAWRQYERHQQAV